MNLELAGKRALITGGSRGIGLAIAKVLAEEGAHVAILARDKARLDAAVAELGGHAIAVQADTGDDDSVRAAVASVVEQFGGIDILVNNAAEPGGTSQGVPPSQVSDQQVWDDVNIKVVGYLRTARAVAPLLTAQGWGRIVNISGLATRQAGNLVATLRNAGVVALTKNLADELGAAGVNVTAVHPGATVTERTPTLLEARARDWGVTPDGAAQRFGAATAIGRTVSAEEVAWVVAFLASPRSVAINGDVVAAGGGALGPINY
jgi:NAD(P)-dependent dehydrogenase (short-subunit alcohol dehydrogenase family)